MCGIVGIITDGKRFRSGDRIMREMLFANMLRGSDATGVYSVDLNYNTSMSKETIPSPRFINTNKLGKEIIFNADIRPFTMGHCRAATLGDKGDVKYAHPIVIKDKLALVHNGTLTYWPKKYGKDSIEHDSTAIADILAEEGLQAFLDKCHGAFALVWHDTRDETIHMFRNTDRPLSMIRVDNAIVFSSELGLSSWIVQRNDHKILKYENLKPLTHYIFEVGELSYKTEELVKTFVPPPPVHSHRFRGEEWEQRQDEWEDSGHGFNRRPVSWGSLPPLHPSNQRRFDQPGGTVVAPSVQSVQAGGENDERYARELERHMAGNLIEGDPTTEQQGSEENTEGNRTTGTITKPRVKRMSGWKDLYVGKEVLVSLEDFDPVESDDNVARYRWIAAPHHPNEYPEVQYRGVMEEGALPSARLLITKKYLWCTIREIVHSKDTGNVIIWGHNLKISEVDDPNWQIARTEHLKEETKALSITHNPGFKLSKPPKAQVIKLETKNFCQGRCCKRPTGELVPNSQMRLVTEQVQGLKSTTKIQQTMRLCEDCVQEYVEDRTKVVPESWKDHKVKETKVEAM